MESTADFPRDGKNKVEVETSESPHIETNRKEFPKPVLSSSANEKINTVGETGGKNSPADVNMEASILADDVIRAGGLGARDDISSFLPVASDSTDFEASIRDAREYEEPQGKICRPGLGWRGTTETN